MSKVHRGTVVQRLMTGNCYCVDDLLCQCVCWEDVTCREQNTSKDQWKDWYPQEAAANLSIGEVVAWRQDDSQ